MSAASLANWKISSTQALLLSVICISLLFNSPFLAQVYKAVAPHKMDDWLFFLSVPVLLASLTVVLISLMGGLFFTRTLVSINLIVSALLFYATSQYGVIFDRDMLRNVAETDSGEAFSYLNFPFLMYLAIVIFTVWLIFKLRRSRSLSVRLKSGLKINLAALLCIATIAGLFYQDYASVGRNHRYLTKYLTPFAFFDSGYKYLRDTYFYPPLPFNALDATPVHNASGQEAIDTLVVVVGETARADKFSLNGYNRPTNPRLSSTQAISFEHVTSCGTATAVSVPCMFSRLDRESYNSRIAESQDNVLDLIHRAGIKVTWVDNNSSCKGVCKRISTIDFDPNAENPLCDGEFCYDDILVQRLHTLLKKSDTSPSVIVLHMIGSHGPTYYRRYPESFKTFTPDCPRSDIQNCSQQALINTYDNTIVYTDHILGEVIDTLKQSNGNTAMLYLSDHGESLGEAGLYLHGFPYSLAPEEQTHVPMVYWDNRLNEPQHRACLDALKGGEFSQDNLFDTLLGLSGVSSSVYRKNMDIFNQCHRT